MLLGTVKATMSGTVGLVATLMLQGCTFYPQLAPVSYSASQEVWRDRDGEIGALSFMVPRPEQHPPMMYSWWLPGIRVDEMIVDGSAVTPAKWLILFDNFNSTLFYAQQPLHVYRAHLQRDLESESLNLNTLHDMTADLYDYVEVFSIPSTAKHVLIRYRPRYPHNLYGPRCELNLSIRSEEERPGSSPS